MDQVEQKNRCVGGDLDGYQFGLTRLTPRINWRDGFYQRSAIETDDGQILWHWKTEDENEPAINPQ